MYLLAAITCIIGAYTAFWFYLKVSAGVCRSKRDLSGKTVIVTGGNTGIGLETARDLARRNARVILACRSPHRGEGAVRDIVQSTGNSNVVYKQLDVSSFKSVRKFVEDILENERRLDVLINNAGVMAVPENSRSVDGLELTMATNHFGHFLLTNLLLPMLKKSAPSRIVVVSSLVYKWSKMEFDNLNGEKPYKDKFQVYGISKLANVLFTRELSERIKGTGVTVNALNPGAVKTELTRDLNALYKLVFLIFMSPFQKTARQGAQTSIYVAVAEELEGVSGKYFSDCREEKLRKHALNMDHAKHLWDYSEKVTGQQFSLQ